MTSQTDTASYLASFMSLIETGIDFSRMSDEGLKACLDIVSGSLLDAALSEVYRRVGNQPDTYFGVVPF